jgi:hypothetical protein
VGAAKANSEAFNRLRSWMPPEGLNLRNLGNLRITGSYWI